MDENRQETPKTTRVLDEVNFLGGPKKIVSNLSSLSKTHKFAHVAKLQAISYMQESISVPGLLRPSCLNKQRRKKGRFGW